MKPFSSLCPGITRHPDLTRHTTSEHLRHLLHSQLIGRGKPQLSTEVGSSPVLCCGKVKSLGVAGCPMLSMSVCRVPGCLYFLAPRLTALSISSGKLRSQWPSYNLPQFLYSRFKMENGAKQNSRTQGPLAGMTVLGSVVFTYLGFRVTPGSEEE